MVRLHTDTSCCVMCWRLLEYLVVPGHAVKAQSTASGIGTLQIQTIQVETGQHTSSVVHNRCKKWLCNINWGSDILDSFPVLLSDLNFNTWQSPIHQKETRRNRQDVQTSGCEFANACIGHVPSSVCWHEIHLKKNKINQHTKLYGALIKIPAVFLRLDSRSDPLSMVLQATWKITNKTCGTNLTKSAYF